MANQSDAWKVVSERMVEIGPLPPEDGAITAFLTALWQACSPTGVDVEFGKLFAIQPLGVQVGSTEMSCTVTFTENRPWIEVLGFEFISLTIESLVIGATQVTINFDGLPPITIPVQQ
jgi:hypothetical protein